MGVLPPRRRDPVRPRRPRHYPCARPPTRGPVPSWGRAPAPPTARTDRVRNRHGTPGAAPFRHTADRIRSSSSSAVLPSPGNRPRGVIAMSTDATAAPSRVPADGRPGSRAPDVWYGDPTQLALDGSARFPVDGAPPAFCVDVGRRVLLAQLDFPGWVLRRVERVSFEEGRSVVRTMTIQLKVRPDAPVFTGAEGPDGTPR